jgi:DNA-binding NarL/FixJ family response regulator
VFLTVVARMKLRIVVADDNPEFLDALVSMLGEEFDIVAKAADGKSALECIRRSRPDVAVLDLSMPAMSGIDVATTLMNDHLGSAVVICSVETDPEIVAAARAAGALGYVFKVRVAKDLVAAVRAAARGQSFMSSA